MNHPTRLKKTNKQIMIVSTERSRRPLGKMLRTNKEIASRNNDGKRTSERTDEREKLTNALSIRQIASPELKNNAVMRRTNKIEKNSEKNSGVACRRRRTVFTNAIVSCIYLILVWKGRKILEFLFIF